jgi:hypothetical protein
MSWFNPTCVTCLEMALGEITLGQYRKSVEQSRMRSKQLIRMDRCRLNRHTFVLWSDSTQNFRTLLGCDRLNSLAATVVHVDELL